MLYSSFSIYFSTNFLSLYTILIDNEILLYNVYVFSSLNVQVVTIGYMLILIFLINILFNSFLGDKMLHLVLKYLARIYSFHKKISFIINVSFHIFTTIITEVFNSASLWCVISKTYYI